VPDCARRQKKTRTKCEALTQGLLGDRSSSSRLGQVSQSDDKDPEREAYKGERKDDGPSDAAACEAQKQTTREKRRRTASNGPGAGKRKKVCVVEGLVGGGGGGGGAAVVELFAAH
jgi:hypothetical protein